MCALWETVEILAWVPRDMLDIPVVAAFAGTTDESETDPTVMATTAPAVTTLLARTCCSLPVRIHPPVPASPRCPGWLEAASPAKPDTQCMVRLGLVRPKV